MVQFDTSGVARDWKGYQFYQFSNQFVAISPEEGFCCVFEVNYTEVVTPIGGLLCRVNAKE